MMDVTEEFIDRYGEPPESVTNLMRISESRLCRSCVYRERHRTRRRGAVALHPSARGSNGGKLILGCTGFEGAKLNRERSAAI
jgi:transcription-repair coupling factor (superfamily II helicase)